jgi:hypothetical protein
MFGYVILNDKPHSFQIWHHQNFETAYTLDGRQCLASKKFVTAVYAKIEIYFLNVFCHSSSPIFASLRSVPEQWGPITLQRIKDVVIGMAQSKSTITETPLLPIEASQNYFAVKNIFGGGLVLFLVYTKLVRAVLLFECCNLSLHAVE